MRTTLAYVMNWEPPDSNGGVSRRSLLAATAAGVTVSTSGCMDLVQGTIGQDNSGQLSLSITTVPADGDREGVQLARALAENLEAVGIDVSFDMRSPLEFHRAILLDHDFDLYVGRHPGGIDPDFLYDALHSAYATESGWQNPFGFARIGFDELLERQRSTDGDERREAVAELLRQLTREYPYPFVPICFPDEFRTVRPDRFEGWDARHLGTRLGYLGLEPRDGATELTVAGTDSRPSRNLNPLAAAYRGRGTIVDLLYDSLVTPAYGDDGGEYRLWLAEDLDWDDSSVTVTLREDCRFHNGDALTAKDVAFTYQFLADTALGRADVPSPSPRYRGRAAAVTNIERHDERTLTLTTTAGRAASERALTVPILPRDVWWSQVEDATEQNQSISQGTWDVVTGDVPAIGSGPFELEDRSEGERVTLTRFEDHFTLREDDLPGPTVDRLRLTIDPGSLAAIETVQSGSADATMSSLETHALDQAREYENVELLESPSRSFYHVGFNVRHAPFSNPHFRRIVARLLDKARLVEDVFDGNATPTAVPVTDEWVPDDLAWNREDPVAPFLGSDGELDVEEARTKFESAGFQYDSGGNLLARY